MMSSLAVSWVPARYRVLLLAERCDPLSACARGAVAVLKIVQDDARAEPSCTAMRSAAQCGMTQDKYQLLMDELDHEQLLCSYSCCALAVRTVREALRGCLCAHARHVDEGVVKTLEAIEVHLQTCYTCAGPPAKQLRMLVAKHMGRGVELLQLQRVK